MTNESLLALARAVYGDKEWSIDRVDKRQVSSGQGATLTFFDPASNDAQAMAVLCWLLNHRLMNDCSHMVKPGCVGEFTNDMEDHFRICGYDHDNTPASLRAAIFQAACRVVAG